MTSLLPPPKKGTGGRRLVAGDRTDFRRRPTPKEAFSRTVKANYGFCQKTPGRTGGALRMVEYGACCPLASRDQPLPVPELTTAADPPPGTSQVIRLREADTRVPECSRRRSEQRIGGGYFATRKPVETITLVPLPGTRRRGRHRAVQPRPLMLDTPPATPVVASPMGTTDGSR